MDEKKFEKMLADFVSMTDEQKAKIREALGLNTVKATRQTTVRASGKYKRTNKEIDPALKCPLQMKQLINSLPSDRAVDIKEWGELAKAGGLQTQQPVERIVGYYKSTILDANYAIVVA